MHTLGNIFQDSGITRSSQVVKSCQFLTPFAVWHVENALDTQNGEVVIQSPDCIWHSFPLSATQSIISSTFAPLPGKGKHYAMTSSKDEATVS
jgi:hypothetical protein